MATKICAQCGTEKDIDQFRKVTNQYTGVHPMSICKACYKTNQEPGKCQMEEWKQEAELRKHWGTEKAEREARERVREAEERAQQETRQRWYAQQSDRQCIECKQVLPATAFGYSVLVPSSDGTYLPVLRQRCEVCNEAYRQNSRQVNPLCPLCGTSTRRFNFLREYRGFHLDLIKVCCKACISRFEVLPETEQMEWLRRAIIAAYGEKAFIYGLHYDESGQVHHIGRTKHLKRRMAVYRRNWHCTIHSYQVLEELPFGGLSMEYESRWMLHALKYGWYIDNFDLLQGGDDGLSGKRQQEELTEVVAHFEPLTAPFPVIEPLLRMFLNTGDARIVHWFIVQTMQVPLL